MKKPNLVIDVGNTFAKAAFFIEDRLIEQYDRLNDREMVRLVKEKHPHSVLVSSVRKGTKRLLKKIGVHAPVSLLSWQTPVPFLNLYETPQTLGTDRIAGVAGALSMFPDRSCLIIDAGTSITYDYVDMEGKYHGGSISPGLDMRFKALHKFTSRLPLISFNKNYDLPGKTTKTAILGGVIEGVIAEINGIVHEYEHFSNDLCIILNGGDAIFFETKIKAHIFAVPNLVLIGLNQILRFNA